MTAMITRPEAEDLLYREALLLDTGAWQELLDLYDPDAEFWIPAWKDETTPTSDPASELSLVYYKGRRNLEDRVKRATSGLSVASTPRPRCVHGVTNVIVSEAGDSAAQVFASFTVHRYDARAERSDLFYGRYEYRLRHDSGRWLIAAKKVILLNDVIPTVLDFYSI